jgi:uncharacterized protein (TIGR02391 family)
MGAKLPMIDPTIIRAVASALTDSDGGLTNTEIDEVFSSFGTPPPPKGTKRYRVSETLLEHQNRTHAGNSFVRFLKEALNLARYTSNRQRFFRLRDAVNEPLALAGLRITEKGEVMRGSVATTLDEVALLAGRLRSALIVRDAHPQVMRYCEREVVEQNPFHAMQEAVKGVAERLRSHTGFGTDGGILYDACFGSNPAQIQLNPQHTESERSAQSGFLNLLKGLHGHFRNPTAHTSRLTWPVAEQDFLDLCSTLSYVHRVLDRVGVK